ncbi:MAG: hypothetical protein KC619_20110 [Myxococcales bacterium]|nr:hypothetical protein [Myxococcales bacterium]
MSEHRIVDDRGRLLTAVGNVDLLVGGLWRWFATGYKPYLVVAFAITMTASALRAWWLTTRASEIHQLESVNDLLVSESEPGRNVAQAALLSAALGLGYVDTEFDCLASEDTAAFDSALCRDVRASLDGFELVAEAHSLDPCEEGASSPGADQGHQALLVRRAAATIAGISTAPRSIERYARRVLTERLEGGVHLAFTGRECLDSSSPRRTPPGYLDALCLGDEQAILVPSFVRRSAPASELAARERRAAELASLLGALVPAMGLFDGAPGPEGEGTDLSARIVQAFFVSIDGVLAVWNERDERPFDVFGPLMDLRGQSYQRVFTDVREARRRYSTRPYVDRGGFGIVRTACAPHRQDTGRLLGVFCVDYLLPTRIHAQRVGTISHALVRVSAEDLDDPDVELLTDTDELRPPDLSELEGFVRQASHSQHPWQSLVDVRDLGQRRLFAVPVRRDGRTLYFLLVRPTSRHQNAWLYVVVLLSIATAVLFVWAVLRRRHAREAENEDAVLRNLQVGAIRTSSANEIVMANDRAEELLGVTLPGIDASHEKPKPVSMLFEDHVFEAQPGSRELRLTTFEEVQRQRREGEESRYFVRKKQPLVGRPRVTWLLVHGSPELYVDARERTDFGIITVPSEQRQAELDLEWDAVFGGEG